MGMRQASHRVVVLARRIARTREVFPLHDRVLHEVLQACQIVGLRGWLGLLLAVSQLLRFNELLR